MFKIYNPELDTAIISKILGKELQKQEFSYTWEKDIVGILSNLGLSEKQAEMYAAQQIRGMRKSEKDIFLPVRQGLELIEIETGISIKGNLGESLEDRQRLIANQILPFITDGEVLDFGCGTGLVAKYIREAKLAENPELDIKFSSADVLDYRDKSMKDLEELFPFYQIIGDDILEIKTKMRAIFATNVFHHCFQPHRVKYILENLGNMMEVGGRFVMIETTSTIDSPKALHDQRNKILRIDGYYNKGLNNPNIPVPGGFRTTSQWVQQMEAVGFRLLHREELGVDQPLVPDWHNLMVFEWTGVRKIIRNR
jgi:SAM-dependent methyltransferase